jgi:hypothetical protein
MSDQASYTDEQLQADIQNETNFFRELFNREIRRIRTTMVTDYRMPYSGWENPYKEIIEICRKAGKNTAPLTEALQRALQSLSALNDLAEEEMVDLQSRMCTFMSNMDNVR